MSFLIIVSVAFIACVIFAAIRITECKTGEVILFTTLALFCYDIAYNKPLFQKQVFKKLNQLLDNADAIKIHNDRSSHSIPFLPFIPKIDPRGHYYGK